MEIWTCSVCGYTYEESFESIPFEDLLDDWICPQCGADASAFNSE